jgi:hypothetical protein
MTEHLKSPSAPSIPNKLKYYLSFSKVSVRNTLDSISHITGPNFLFSFASNGTRYKKPWRDIGQDMTGQHVQLVQHSFSALYHKAPPVHWTVRLRRLEYRRTGQRNRDRKTKRKERKRKRGWREREKCFVGSNCLPRCR